MLYTIFDLETTGFNGTSDAVCQFAFITVNQNLLPVRARNYYFYKEGMPWSEQAAAVHGLTRSFLKQYEDEYEQNLIRMYTVLQRGNLVGHNSNGFDIPFANQFLMREGFPPIVPGVCYDTMLLRRLGFLRARLFSWPRLCSRRTPVTSGPTMLAMMSPQQRVACGKLSRRGCAH